MSIVNRVAIDLDKWKSYKNAIAMLALGQIVEKNNNQ